MNIISLLKDTITRSVQDKLKDVKLGFIDGVSSFAGYLFFIFIAIFLGLSIFIFLGIGLGEVLSDAFDSRAAGYFATAGVYVLLVALLVLMRTSIVNAFASVFIKVLTRQEDDDDDDENDD